MTCPLCGRMGLGAVSGGIRRHWTDDYWSLPCPYRRSESDIAKLGASLEDLLAHVDRNRIGTWGMDALTEIWRKSL